MDLEASETSVEKPLVIGKSAPGRKKMDKIEADKNNVARIETVSIYLFIFNFFSETSISI